VSARAISAQIRRKLGPLTPAILEAVQRRALAATETLSSLLPRSWVPFCRKPENQGN